MPAFVDESQIHLKAGNGGAGAVSFRREAHVAKGGPDGGDGGNGGSIYLEASHDMASLLAFADHPHRRGEDGAHGSGKRRNGRAGGDLVVRVPEGTVVKTRDGDVLADLSSHGDQLLAARAGRGGHGNARFLANRLRAPSFAEQGEYGEEIWLNLELKLIADVALVGFPNVGKSTLISRISAARPKIADYPFTTLEPHLGVVTTGRGDPGATEFTVADIPGLVEGASDGRGLGIEFLRHIERARVLLVLADLAPTADRPPAEQVEVLLLELERYRPELLERPRVIVASRADLRERDAPEFDGAELAISAATGVGLVELVNRLGTLVEMARIRTPRPAREPVVHRPEPEGFAVERNGAEYVVVGRDVERAVAVSDLNDADALALVQRRLRRMGVDRALARAGAREGDNVRIGDLSFEFNQER
jgi:GTP-binding protein